MFWGNAGGEKPVFTCRPLLLVVPQGTARRLTMQVLADTLVVGGERSQRLMALHAVFAISCSVTNTNLPNFAAEKSNWQVELGSDRWAF